MSASPLDYQPPVDRRKSIAVRIAVYLGVGVAVLLAVPIVGGNHRVTSWMDANTGTMRWETSWFGYVTERHLVVSPIEGRLLQLGVAMPRNWRFLHSRTGRGVACGTAPPIYNAAMMPRNVVAKLTDAELLGLVAIAQTPSPGRAEQQAIDGLVSLALDR